MLIRACSRVTQVNTNFVDSWLTYLGSQARVSGLATGKAPVVSDIEKALNLYTTEAKKTSFALESSFKLYKDSTCVRLLLPPLCSQHALL